MPSDWLPGNRHSPLGLHCEAFQLTVHGLLAQDVWWHIKRANSETTLFRPSWAMCITGVALAFLFRLQLTCRQGILRAQLQKGQKAFFNFGLSKWVEPGKSGKPGTQLWWGEPPRKEASGLGGLGLVTPVCVFPGDILLKKVFSEKGGSSLSS